MISAIPIAALKNSTKIQSLSADFPGSEVRASFCAGGGRLQKKSKKGVDDNYRLRYSDDSYRQE
jgi:hypothetical protein